MTAKKSISQKLIEKMYSESYSTISGDGKAFEVPESGTLGLLANGYKGLIAWRIKRGKIPIFKTTKSESKNKA